MRTLFCSTARMPLSVHTICPTGSLSSKKRRWGYVLLLSDPIKQLMFCKAGYLYWLCYRNLFFTATMATFATFLAKAGLSTMSSGENTQRITNSSDPTCDAATRCSPDKMSVVIKSDCTIFGTVFGTNFNILAKHSHRLHSWLQLMVSCHITQYFFALQYRILLLWKSQKLRLTQAQKQCTPNTVS